MSNTIEKILPGVAGIDIGKESNFVAVAGQPVRQFSTMTVGIRQLAQYLREQKVQRVCMESTGVYWVPLYDYLDQAGLDVTLFNGTFARNVPGRKTDVQDSQWHAMLHSYGLLKKSFIPEDVIRQLRGATRDRQNLLEDKSRCLLRMQKSLDLMNIRPHNVLSQLEGASGMALLEAIVGGERDPQRLLALCHVSIREKKAQAMLESLEGSWDEQHLFSLKVAYRQYGSVQELMGLCDQRIEKILQSLVQDKPEQLSTAVSDSSHNTPKIDGLKTYLATCCGVEAISLPGIGPNLALQLLAETGTDLSAWKTCKEFVSWAGLAPGNNQSGQKRRRVSKRQKTRVGQLFRQAAMNVAGSKHTALGAFYGRIKGRRSSAVAIKATARKLAVSYYNLMTKGAAYVEQGRLQYDQRCLQNRFKQVIRHAKALGLDVIVSSTGELVTA